MCYGYFILRASPIGVKYLETKTTINPEAYNYLNFNLELV